jgi:outer membrane protein insertion porin family
LGLKTGDEVDERTAVELRARALRYLTHSGFPHARVQVDEISPLGSAISSFALKVVEGEPLTVARTAFTGATRISRAVLVQNVSLREGDILDQAVAERDQQRLIDVYRSHGFWAAQVSPPHIDVSGSKAFISYAVAAGDRIAFYFSGNRTVSDAVLADLRPNTGEPLSDSDLTLWAGRIKNYYQRLGFPDTQVKVRGFVESRRGLMRYVFVVNEGSPLRVKKIELPGAELFPAALLENDLRARVENALVPASWFGMITAQDVDAVMDGPTPLSSPQLRREPVDSFVPPSERFLPSLYDEGIEQMVGAYRDQGYLRAKVGPAELDRHGTSATVRIPIVAGTRTVLDSVSFQECHAFPPAQLLSAVESENKNMILASPYSPSAVEESRIALTRLYRNEGYVYARIFADVAFADNMRKANVTFRFEEGPQVFIDRVLVRGNHYTRESVIRRRVSLKSNDVYRLDQALKDQRTIAAVGAFSSVRVKLVDEEKPAERKDLVAEVVERDRQPVELAWGISTADGPRMRLSYSHLNLFGSGAEFVSSAKINRQVFFVNEIYGPYADEMKKRYESQSLLDKVGREIRAGVQLPRQVDLPGTPLWRLDLLETRDVAIPYTLQETSATLGVDFALAERLHLAIEPQVSQTDLQCPPSAAGCATVANGYNPGIVIAEGTQQTFKIGPTLTWEHRDNPFEATHGWFFRLRGVYATGRSEAPNAAFEPFSFTKADAVFTFYVPLHQLLLAMSLQAGAIKLLSGTGVPLDQEFYLGGRDTLRGFVEQALIPQDACVVANDESRPGCHEKIPIAIAPVTQGGNYFALWRSDLRLPLSGALSVAVFADVGNLWVEFPSKEDLVLRLGTGVGLRYATPVGALALDFGINPFFRNRNAEPVSQIHFSVGAF